MPPAKWRPLCLSLNVSMILLISTASLSTLKTKNKRFVRKRFLIYKHSRGKDKMVVKSFYVDKNSYAALRVPDRRNHVGLLSLKNIGQF